MPLAVLATRTFRVSPSGDGSRTVRLAPGEIDVLALDFADVVGDLAFSGTPTWTSSNTSALTVTSEDSSGNVSRVMVTGVAVGESLLTCRAILTGSAREYRRSITVHVRSPL